MNNEKTIRIFVGSSITDLKLERMELAAFIQGLNNKYHNRGIFIECYICEETPSSMRADGSQAAHNDYISGNADATVFMFYHKAGEFTMEELKLARKAFLKNGKPNVYVFFKAVNGEPDVNDDIKNAVNLVFNDFGHYYKMFDDVDTVKLEVLQFLADMLPGKGEIVVKNGAIYMNGELIKDISAANIFAYQNNPDLKKLKEQIDNLRKLELDAAGKGDETSALRYSASRGELEKQYAELEADILDTLKFFYEENKKGKADPVLAEALRQLELGNIAMVKTLIPQDELDRMAQSIAKRRELSESQFRDEEEQLLARTRARIKTLKLDLENKNRFAEIEHAYENAYEAANKVGDYDFIYDYTDFLYEQKNYPKAIAIAERLKYIYDDSDKRNEITDFDRAKLFNHLGLLYNNNNNLEKVESVYIESLAIFRSIFNEESTPKNEDAVATICNNLATFYAKNGKPAEAEKLMQEAIDVYRRLADTVSREAYEPAVAMTCNNLGNLYKNTGKPAEAEKLYKEALEIRRRLADTVSREAYEPAVAETCNNLGNFYAVNGKSDEAEKLFKEALEIYRRLADTVSREAYEPDVAMTCNNLGAFYADNDKPAEAEKLYQEALEIYRRLADTVSREAHEPDVAMSLFNMGCLYISLGDNDLSEKYFAEAVSIAEKYKV